MSYDIETVGFCPDYYSVFEVPSSDGKKIYKVDLSGEQGHCSCEGYKFRQDCKHMRKVWKEACLYNPQWKDAGPGTLKPVEYYGYPPSSQDKCPGCGQEMVLVRIAV